MRNTISFYLEVFENTNFLFRIIDNLYLLYVNGDLTKLICQVRDKPCCSAYLSLMDNLL